MFTGLILELGAVAALERKSEGGRLSVKGREIARDLALGDSISVNGVCLTVVSMQRETFTFDVSSETLRSTNLGGLKQGDRVNLEPSLTPSSRLGGHFVTGHVDGIGTIRSKAPSGDEVRIEIEAPGEVLGYLVRKGSVAVDGISLTVVDVLADAFSVVIIPHTAGMTTIGFKKTGDTVNLESDILGKYVATFLSGGKAPSPYSARPERTADTEFLSTLKKSGFIS